ncbi:alpha/beta fold hydrolase [Novosphingobium sp. FSY-8]|uniref:Alpha/beta fold hydrolase n=1 Tax=Novosphingobium ovatum TaxID=1908523 RepID=A0ABW9XF23_9SPHN|nr:alpha/beta fold hydrolase [Novosphingobium ovatum]NBC37145.1 alpha/beta fold hydrolase [Novosphingobium ovatum]
MPDNTTPPNPFAQMMEGMMQIPGMDALAPMAQQWLNPALNPATAGIAAPLTDPDDAARWAEISARLQTMWLDFQTEQAAKLAATDPLAESEKLAAAAPKVLDNMLSATPFFTAPGQWEKLVEGWSRHMPFAQPEVQQKLWADSMALWQGVMAQYTPGEDGKTPNGQPAPALPRHDRRFADAAWRDNPYFALIHQTYLMMAEQIIAMADATEGLEPERKAQLSFVTRTLVDALSPDHFPMTNPLVIEQALESRGESLVKGFAHMLDDLRRGQLSHTDTNQFEIGRNVAVTPGKVVHQSRLFEVIQYSPTTDTVLETPLVIFPPWINRFYILDLNPKKSFVKWAVDQGITVFMVSWKSADASMADVTMDDYIAAQIEAIDVARERLKAPSAHTIGYCVAGTTLAATLAVLARRGQADKVASATFFTAQVDFEKAGDLKAFVDDQQLATLSALAPDGYLDGRYLAATFNLLRGTDLIWNYVTNNYLLGREYPAFDLLFWNGDTTNLPAGWHLDYLRNLYRDNLLVQPDALSAGGTPIDLRQITTPCYIQAGKEDHIAPAESVWRFTRLLGQAPHVFLLAGSGHIAGVVNPPAGGKYQYWTNDAAPDTLDAFVAGAKETPGSWWPHWAAWLRGVTPAEVAAKGKRVPGGRGDKVLGDAPGTYVRMR